MKLWPVLFLVSSAVAQHVQPSSHLAAETLIGPFETCASVRTYKGQTPTQHSKTQAPTLVVDKTIPHTFTVRCENGVFGVVIDNNLHKVEVTCWEHPNKK